MLLCALSGIQSKTAGDLNSRVRVEERQVSFGDSVQVKPHPVMLSIDVCVVSLGCAVCSRCSKYCLLQR